MAVEHLKCGWCDPGTEFSAVNLSSSVWRVTSFSDSTAPGSRRNRSPEPNTTLPPAPLHLDTLLPGKDCNIVKGLLGSRWISSQVIYTLKEYRTFKRLTVCMGSESPFPFKEKLLACYFFHYSAYCNFIELVLYCIKSSHSLLIPRFLIIWW